MVSKGSTEFNIFNWLSNLKKFSSFNWLQKLAKCDLKGIKIAIFPQNYKNFQKIAPGPQRRGNPPSDPSVISLVCDAFSSFSFFTAPPQLNTYICILKTLAFGLSPPLYATSCLRTNPNSRLLIFHSKVFLSHKKSLLLKNFEDVILHVICGLSPPNQKSWLRLRQNSRNFYVWLFPF